MVADRRRIERAGVPITCGDPAISAISGRRATWPCPWSLRSTQPTPMRWQDEGVDERVCWINALTANAPNSVGKAFRPDVVINQMPYEHHIGSVLRALDPPLLLGCLRNTLFSVKNNLDGYGARVLPQGLAPLFRNPLGRWWLLNRHRARHRNDLERILATYDRFVMFAPPSLEELPE